MDFKRALIRPQKGTFCKPKEPLLAPKRACIDFEMSENSLQILINQRSIAFLFILQFTFFNDFQRFTLKTCKIKIKELSLP